MNILVLNSGSSSLKFQLFNTNDNSVLVKGEVEKIGEICPNHKEATKQVFAQVKDYKIDAIGHRVVHGGEAFKTATIANEKTLKQVDEVSNLAPLHNPANLMGVRACMELYPKIKNVMVFDTAFHTTLPKSAYMYAIPETDYKKLGLRRYGFHGTSHNYVSRKCAELFGKPREQLRIISCHIGNGCSICAIDHGKSIDTSMGLTPLEGLVMAIRSGDIDPACVQYIAKGHNFTIDQTINYLNKECGYKALANLNTADFRQVMWSSGMDKVKTIPATKEQRASASLAIEIFAYRILKYVGSYIATMGGVDAIIWTGGIGSNMPLVRSLVHNKLGFVGANIDESKNDLYYCNMKTGEITANGAKVRTFCITTNEELEIANETVKLLGGKK